MTSVVVSLPGLRRQRREPRLRRWLRAQVARWQDAAQRRALRRAVMDMDEHMLNDLGVSRAQVLFELDR